MALRLAATIAIALAGMTLCNFPARSEGEVDCADTELGVAGADFTTKCLLFEKSVFFAGEGVGPGDARHELIEATNLKNGVYLVTISIRLTAKHYGLNHDDIKKNFATMFRNVPAKGWTNMEDKADFEIAEFVSNGKACVAWQRYLNRSYGIYKRLVFGFGCSGSDVGPVYTALDSLTAPGD